MQSNISPEYDYSNGKQKLTGFRVTNVVSAKIRDIGKTTKVVDDAVTAGGNDVQVQNISFTIDDPEDLKKQAREAAVADAKAKAQTLASATGVAVGEPISISESSAVSPIPSPPGPPKKPRSPPPGPGGAPGRTRPPRSFRGMRDRAPPRAGTSRIGRNPVVRYNVEIERPPPPEIRDT